MNLASSSDASVKKELINVTCTALLTSIILSSLLEASVRERRTMDNLVARSRNSSIADMKQSASLGTSLNAVPKRSKLSDQE